MTVTVDPIILVSLLATISFCFFTNKFLKG